MAFYSYLSTKIIIAFITKSYQDLFGVRSYINAKIKGNNTGQISIGNTLVHNYCFSGYGAEFEMGIKFHNLLILKKESRPTFRDRTTFFYYKSLSAMTNNMIANNSLIFYNYPNRFL